MPNMSGEKTESTAPINRFLPCLPAGIGQQYANELGDSTDWILDPFGALPRFSVEMARAGQRVLVTTGNPISRFLMDLEANPPRFADLTALLSDLAAVRKENTRLELHLQSLYLTRCENCKRELPAEAFLWDSKTNTLIGRIYNCTCGSSGEHAATPEDLELAARWMKADKIHRSRALERVSPINDPDRPFAEEALSFYPPRAVYAIGMIINRLEGLSTSEEARRNLSALILFAIDSTNVLWSQHNERPRPRLLTFPAVFRENNVWMAFEAGVKALGSNENAVPLTIWPEQPPESGGVCVYEGPLRELARELKGIPIKGVVSPIPRPNQAFWTLSALWSGWIWGADSVGSFKALLRRRRYDWQWHAEALKSLFTNLSVLIKDETPFIGILAEPEPAFLTAVFLAVQSAGFELNTLDMSPEMDADQLVWKKISVRRTYAENKTSNSGMISPRGQKKPLPLDVNFIRKALRDLLETEHKPMNYLALHAGVLVILAKKGMLTWSDDSVSQIEKIIPQALSSEEFIHLEYRTSHESGIWSLRRWDQQQTLEGL